MKLFRPVSLLLSINIVLSSFIPSLCAEAQSEPQYPIVYHEKYNIGFGGPAGWLFQKLHPFDGTKYRRIADYIQKALPVEANRPWCHTPHRPVTEAEKLLVHTPEYLKTLKQSSTISRAVDFGPLLSRIPNHTLQKLILRPMEWATAGTIIAAQLALEHGWAVNLSGGYHHAAPSHAEGGCIFSDVPIALQVLWLKHPDLKVLIIDLDAHQGNGFEKALLNDPRVLYFDVFNSQVVPQDAQIIQDAHNIIAYPLKGGRLSSEFWGVELSEFCERCVDRKVTDVEYLSQMRTGLATAFARAQQYFGKAPDLIVYNGGSDINSNDPWGCLDVSETAIIARDQYIFEQAFARNIPICMVLSGGYAPRSAEIISASVINIVKNVICRSKF